MLACFLQTLPSVWAAPQSRRQFLVLIDRYLRAHQCTRPTWLREACDARLKASSALQELLRYLLRFNAVSFLRYLQCLRAAAGPTTEWMLLSAANTVFQEAKARVYKVTHDVPQMGEAARNKAGAAVPKAEPQLVPVLEEMPKWSLLQQVAEEVQTQRGLLASRAGDPAATANGHSAGGSGNAARHAHSGAQVPYEGASRGDAGGSAPDRHAHSGAQLRTHGSSGGGGGVAARANSGVDSAVIDLLDSQSPVKSRKRVCTDADASRADGGRDSPPASPPAMLGARGLNSAGSTDDVAGMLDEAECDPHAWINALPGEVAAACASAPVLLLAQERHMLTELRAILAVDGGQAYLQKLYDMFLIERLTGSRGASGIVPDAPPAEQTAAGDASTSGSVPAAGAAASAGRGAAAGRGGASRGRGRGGRGRGGKPGGGATRKEQGMYKCASALVARQRTVALSSAVFSCASAMSRAICAARGQSESNDWHAKEFQLLSSCRSEFVCRLQRLV